MWRLLLVLVAAAAPRLADGRVTINSNGGYENVVVSISKDVPPIVCPQLIQNIQAVFSGASKYLLEATDGQVYFRRVTVVMPPKWTSAGCERLLAPTSQSSIKDAAFRVGGEHAIFGHYPWTQQSRGCGLQGDFISMGYNYILGFNETENDIGYNGYDRIVSSSAAYAASPIHVPSITEKSIVHEWAKYRYGVFEEVGFANDPIYPGSYLDGAERKPTACTNTPLRGTWSEGCDESYYGSEKNSSCQLVPAGTGENDNVISSIMAHPELKNVKHFCNNKTHNPEAPTKHNYMCDRRPAYDVVMSHADFRDLARDGSLDIPETEFTFKQIAQPKFVLLVEKTRNMNLRDVWKFLKLAVRKFIKYDLPMGTEIGLITVSTNSVKTLANMTSLNSNSMRRALADKLPNYPNEKDGGNIALYRGVNEAIRMMKLNGESAAGSVIILVSQGMVSTNDIEASAEILHKEDVTLASIEYPSSGDGKIFSLSNSTNGPHFVIREEGVGTATHMSTFVQLINAFMNIQKFFTEDVASSWPTLVHQAEYKGNALTTVESKFGFDAQSPGEFFIFTTNPNDPKIDSVELISPSHIKYTTQLSDLHDINVIKIDAQINETGVWRYRIERLGDSHQSHFVQVVTNSSADDLHVRLYTNVDTDKIANLTGTPLVLFVEVKRNESPVIDADVEALIVSGNEKWHVSLWDNGNGDADVTGGDGVYSRYFIVPSGVTGTQLEISARVSFNPHRAQYFVAGAASRPLEHHGQQPRHHLSYEKIPVATASTTLASTSQIRCCGSRITPTSRDQYKRLHFTERVSNTVVLKIGDIPPTGYYPPGRIGDLKLGWIDRNSKKLGMEWTAPGDDFDQGVVKRYQVFYLSDKSRERPEVLAQTCFSCNGTKWSGSCHEFVADLEAGVRDNVTIGLPSYNSYRVFMRAIDHVGKCGRMSNIVKIKVSPVPKEVETPHAPRSGQILSSTGSTMAPSLTGELNKKELLIFVVCGVAFVLLIGVLIVSLLFCRRVGGPARAKGVGGVGKKNSADTKIAAISDSKSPIHWSASELLGEHEKTQRHSLYGGSVSPNGSGSDPSKGQGNHSTPSPPPDLNILPNGEYMAAGGSGRSRSSPDSYDDPESPMPIPVSVRSNNGRADYAVCVDGTTGAHHVVHHHMHNMHMDPRLAPYQGHHHGQQQLLQYENYHHGGYLQQQQQPAGGVVVPAPPPPHNGGAHFNGYSNVVVGTYAPPNTRFSTVMNNSSPTSSNSPLPPPNYNASHLIHYDPDVQGSLSSVNSKAKRNITMV